MPQLTRTQENVLYNKLRLIKGQTKQELHCQIGTVKALTSSGFALEIERTPFFKKVSYFYLNQPLDIIPKIFNQEQLLTVWLDTDPSARSLYKLYGCPPMWKTIEFPDGLILFSRPSRVMKRDHTEVDGVSYQFQLDGEWIGQGSVCEFKYFEEIVAPELQTDLQELRRIAKN
jgi:hypothetical protein